MAQSNNSLFRLMFGRFFNLSALYSDIKSNPDSRNVSTLLGKKSIKYSIIYVLMLGVALVSAFFMVSTMHDGAIFYGILLLILAVALGFSGLLYMLLAVISAVYQLRVNRKSIGWVALSVSLVLVVGLVVAVLILAN